VSAFAPGSISLRLYPHLDRSAPEIVEELRAQAALAVEHGFAGVMTSEHHGGFAGYVPNPLQLAGFLLDAMPSGWAAPCPLLLPLRPAALVAEEVAWLAARFPGRVGLGVAAGALPSDFEVMGADLEHLTARFESALVDVVRLLTRGDPGGLLEGDPAIAGCATRPVPVLSAASSLTAARRAARVGAGILVDSLCTVERVRALTDAYRDAGGTHACVLVRRVWLGKPFRADVQRQVGVYRGYAGAAARNWGADELIAATEPRELGERIGDVASRAGADALNLRLHTPGIPPSVIRDQIVRLGRDVVAPDYIGLRFHHGGHPCS
jgi:alkanesulfonate monooxygenase SsuD/methylene tetrahydromethanopterin reductase-like flavin-dependent oxidoreductase (luciferase family)